MKNIRVFILAFLLVCTFLSIGGNQIFAVTIGDPTSLAILDSYVFGNVSVAGDQLYYVRYKIVYSSSPAYAAKDTFQMAIFSPTGTLITYRALNYYGESAMSVYLSPGNALTWGASNQIKIQGSPTFFPILTEDVNMDTKILSSGDYLSASQLSSILLTQAQVLQTDLGQSFLSNGLLTPAGKSYILLAMPSGFESLGLSIFGTYQSPVTVPSSTPWASNGTSAAIAREGTKLKSAIEGTVSIFGITGGWGDFWILGIFYFMFAAIVFAATKKPEWALGSGIPVLLAGGWIGLANGQVLQGVLIIILCLGILFSIMFVLEKIG